MADLKEYTRKMNFTFPDTGKWDATHIQLSCMLRMTDAAEAMAKNYTDLQRDLEWYKKAYANQKSRAEKLERQLAGQKGAKTRLKNKMLSAAIKDATETL